MSVSNKDYHNIDGINGGAYIHNLYKFEDVPFCFDNRSNNNINVNNSNDDNITSINSRSLIRDDEPIYVDDNNNNAVVQDNINDGNSEGPNIPAIAVLAAPSSLSFSL